MHLNCKFIYQVMKRIVKSTINHHFQIIGYPEEAVGDVIMMNLCSCYEINSKKPIQVK